jgi:hypothetical protein
MRRRRDFGLHPEISWDNQGMPLHPFGHRCESHSHVPTFWRGRREIGAVLVSLVAALSAASCTSTDEREPPRTAALSARLSTGLVSHSAAERGEVFIKATASKDWGTMFRCFAPEARELVAVEIVTMLQYGVVASGKPNAAFDEILKKHHFDPEQAQAGVKEAMHVAKSGDERGKRTDPRALVTAYVRSVEDKEGFVSDLLTWADQNWSNRRGGPAKSASIRDIEVSVESATATLANGARSSWALTFRHVNGDWGLVLPEREYAPSGWNDGFLFDYLDDLHEWRF